MNEEERDLALGAGATLIGVNARDLDTLEMQPERARAVLDSLPDGVVKAHFSGLSRPEHVRAASETGADAALIGEVLMRADDPCPYFRASSTRPVAARRRKLHLGLGRA